MKVQYAREILDNWIEVKAGRIREAGESFGLVLRLRGNAMPQICFPAQAGQGHSPDEPEGNSER